MAMYSISGVMMPLARVVHLGDVVHPLWHGGACGYKVKAQAIASLASAARWLAKVRARKRGELLDSVVALGNPRGAKRTQAPTGYRWLTLGSV
jgi:hypothetical protein